MPRLLLPLRCLTFGLLGLSLVLGSASPSIAQAPPSPIANPSVAEADRLMQQAQTPNIPPQIQQALFFQAEQRYRQAGQTQKMEIAQVKQAIAFYHDGEYQRATQTLPMLERYDASHPAWVDYLNLKARLLLQSGDDRRALGTIQRVGPVIDFKARSMVALTSGEIYRANSWYRTARANLSAAAAMTENRIERVDAISALGRLELDLGQYAAAGDRFKAAIAQRQQIGFITGRRNQLELVRDFNDLGRVNQALGQWPESRQQYQRSLDVLKSVQAPNLEIQSYLLMAQLAMRQSDWPAAQQAISQTQGLRGHAASQIAIADTQADYHRQQGQWDAAISQYQKALAIADRDRNPATIANLNANIGWVQLQQGQLKAAIATLEQSIQTYEVLREDVNTGDQISLVDQQAQAFQSLQQAYVRNQQPEQALVIAERGRARAFVELLSARLTDNKIAPIAPPTLAQISAIAKTKQATIITYSTIADPLKKVETDLYIWVVQPDGKIQFQAVDLRSPKPPTTTPIAANPPQLAPKQLAPKQLAPKQLAFAFRSSRKIKISTALPTPTTDTPSPTGAFRSGYDLLIAPIAQWLPKSPIDRVIIVPQGALFSMPFHALRSADGKYLLESHTLQIAPSIQTLTLKSTRPRSPLRSKPLVIGNPAPMPENLDPLPGSQQEAQAIAKLLNTQALIGPQATEKTVLAQLRQASVIHFATHGLLDENQGMASAIALVAGPDDDGLLTAGELSEIPLTANLAVLSACETGRGKITGDGVLGLSRSLMLAGVPNVVVSLWAVPDQATASLMTEYYRQMPQQPTQAQALRQAMLTTLKQYPDPHDWAGFVLLSAD
jgi:tetratricopeptide (TPR) repeat protein